MTERIEVGRLRTRRSLGLAGLLVALVGLMTAGMLMGAVSVGVGDLVHAFGVHLGFLDEPARLTDSVLWAIRLPRVLAGAFVGAGLGATGAALQGTFRNHMADPHLVGLAPSAGLGAVAGIALTPAGGSPILMMFLAAVGGVAAALLMRRIAQQVLESTQFLLVGLALGLGMLAWLGAIVLAWDSPRVPTFTFWVFGGLSGSTWTMLTAAAPFMIAAAAVLLILARPLDLLALGETEARHLGVDVDRFVRAVLIACGIGIGGAVGLGGVIGFVGLVVPLILRRWFGPGHRWLIGLSAVGGAAMVVAADTLARTVAAPVEIPVGLLTAIVGAPVFLWFLTRAGRSAA
ncbi:MAG: iron ABC transporter permease [Acidimicrobiia bacterium]|nr:iron ABC transporter permease [Acidimicrobiia bacterium]